MVPTAGMMLVALCLNERVKGFEIKATADIIPEFGLQFIDAGI